MVEIIRYNKTYKEDFKKLNYEWLEKYFKVEPVDAKLLSHPETEVVEKGGEIFIALEDNIAIGTACIIKYDAVSCEIGKMAVTRTAQGKGVGRLLMHNCLDECRMKGFRKVILYSNDLLVPAKKLYESMGFKEVPNLDSYYERGGVKYEKYL